MTMHDIFSVIKIIRTSLNTPIFSVCNTEKLEIWIGNKAIEKCVARIHMSVQLFQMGIQAF